VARPEITAAEVLPEQQEIQVTQVLAAAELVAVPAVTEMQILDTEQ
jgi:hypothetical protein